MKDFFKNNLNGILGTLIFHLVLVIIFMSFKISQIIDDYEEIIIIEFSEPVPVIEKKQIDLSEIIPELKQLRRTNEAVNLAEEFKKEVSTEEYVKQLKEELNIKDPEEGWKEKLEEKFAIKEDKEKEEQLANPNINPDETNVTYEIKDRFARYIHKPIYKCKGSATIVLNIMVDVKGEVVSSSADHSLSSYSDECFVQEAIDAARRSKFNANYNAPSRQKGIITYKFVAQ